MAQPRDTRRTRANTIPDVPRTLRHLDTDKQWTERDTPNKLYCTAVEAGYRLRGLAHVLYGIGVGKDFMRKEMHFLGAAADDVALALERASAAQWEHWEAEDRKPAKRLPAPAKVAKVRAVA